MNGEKAVEYCAWDTKKCEKHGCKEQRRKTFEIERWLIDRGKYIRWGSTAITACRCKHCNQRLIKSFTHHGGGAV